MKSRNKKETYLIDPPEGWKYGFPKKVSEIMIDLKQQCVDLGYPKNLADQYRENFIVGISKIKE